MKKFSVFLLAIIVAMLFCAGTVSAADTPFGGMYVSGGSTGQALSTTAAKVTLFAGDFPSSSSDGEQSIVSSNSTDTITLAPGAYKITWTYSGTADATTAITFTLRDAGAAITGASSKINHPASTAVTGAITAIYRPTSTATITLYAAAASGTPTITATDMQMVITRLK